MEIEPFENGYRLVVLIMTASSTISMLPCTPYARGHHTLRQIIRLDPDQRQDEERMRSGQSRASKGSWMMVTSIVHQIRNPLQGAGGGIKIGKSVAVEVIDARYTAHQKGESNFDVQDCTVVDSLVSGPQQPPLPTAATRRRPAQICRPLQRNGGGHT